METYNSANFRVEPGQWTGEPVVILRDEQAGAAATIVPGLGANCVAWSVPHRGQSLEVLETPPTAEDLRTRRFRAGIPVLWPFPGRVREARYQFQHTEHSLARTDKLGVHHIHGLVNQASWRVLEQGAGPQGARLRLGIGPSDIAEELTEGYPFEFALSLEFTLTGRSLTIDLQVENRGSQEMPFSYGLHPYFRAPLLRSEQVPDRSACLVLLPAATRWPATEGLPVGAAQPVAPEEDFRQWRPLGNQPFDHLYSDISFEGEWTTAAYRDPGAGLEVQVRADHNFHDWVLFTQPNRPSLCLEPYTSPPNAINMEAEGITGANLLILAPGNSWQARVGLEVSEF